MSERQYDIDQKNICFELTLTMWSHVQHSNKKILIQNDKEM